MKSWQIVHVVAGAFILASLMLSQLHSPWWLAFTAFVGLNLLQAGFSKWCLMETLLRRFGVQGGC
ncbi:MAG: DUF2892 domain-containing protein [Burkholderiales bacterium]|uniref:YgaP family membrane protein n=1 Tax=Inhella sp. TaxID=1921806 RepID=UPI001AD3C233|nr:DUF2892 domain-containing protein [Burkholderiales bacterium]